MESYDAIVIGTGGVGSATLFHLAKRGQRVLGLDRFPPAHSRGSSHGQTRIIRQAYFEHPDYVPLLRRTYEMWRDLESAANASLLQEVGLLEVGPAEGVLIPGVLRSVRQHDLEIQRFSAEEARKQFPFLIPDEMQVVFEPTAGYLLVEECVKAHLRLAVAAGATWKQEAVLDWKATNTGVQVRTADADYVADQVIVCGGAWSTVLLNDIGVDLQVMEKHQYWFEAPKLTNDLPAFFFEDSQGDFYGLPQIAETGLKIAQHTGGRLHEEPIDLATAKHDADLDQVRRFAATHCKFPVGNVRSQQACMYTMSPDGHFIVDQHPRHANVSFAGGMSGHGFKFAPVLGSILAQMACGEQPELAIDFLGLGRFEAK